MNMPGFTAERSLDAPRGRYRSEPARRIAIGRRRSGDSELRQLRLHSRPMRGKRRKAARRLQRLRRGQLLYGAGQFPLLD